jgi:hypothetical protein
MNKNEYLDIEAQEGSDNEGHDNVVKKLDPESEEETRDDDLEDLVSKFTQGNKDIKRVLEKYREEVVKTDKAQIKEIVGLGVRAKKRTFAEMKSEYTNFDEDNLPIAARIMRERGKEIQTKDFDKKIFNISKYKRTLLENVDDESNLEEVNEILEKHENDVKKKISEQSTEFVKKFKERIAENDKILESVINLNEYPAGVVKLNPRPRGMIANSNSFLQAINKQGTSNCGSNIQPTITTNITANPTTAKQTSSYQTNVHSVFRNRKNTPLSESDNRNNVAGIFEGGYYEPKQIVKLNKN